jgi:hypothetical protein
MIPTSIKLEDAVTGQQCDHIVGFILSDVPQYGGSDRLATKREGVAVDQAFKFCPLCGAELTPSIQATPGWTGLREHLQLLELQPQSLLDWLRPK